MKFLRALWRDESGAYLVEFAFTFPIIAMLLLGGFDIGYQTLKRASLVGAVRDAARDAITKSAGCSTDRSQMIEEEIRRAMAPYNINGSTLTVEARSYAGEGGFGGVGKPEPLTNDLNNNGRYDPGDSYTDINGDGQWSEDRGKVGDLGGPGDVVVYTAEFQAPTLFLNLPLLGGRDWITLEASTVARNEPYKCEE
ncbi:TadE/TadG family type IV pilus assembly protein [Pedomonas mirosovicensis]|uniref:TadE/TadG family type IV pilus assembly protein n=1 Tax=Pedomonas mirosovicensis TaxID=2908641 RepID=UPI0021671B2A|nr:TadE/TadG family type IV pilus assembly protein [Pedomonas mirosovicensis]MCH8685524.1 pilus assembly protein [Pedomonas mirosovicensis]